MYLMLFLAYCSYKGLAYSTVSSYISVLNYMQKLSGFVDVSGNFVAKKMLQGLRKTTAESDYRLPITHSILKSLIRSFECLNFSYFLSFNESHVFNSFLCLSPHWRNNSCEYTSEQHPMTVCTVLTK